MRQLQYGLIALAAAGSLLLVIFLILSLGCVLSSDCATWPKQFVAAPLDPCAASKPTLTASADDGEVTLTWELPEGRQLAVKRYRQSIQGETHVGIHGIYDISTEGNSHVVRGLMNGVVYMFLVEAAVPESLVEAAVPESLVEAAVPESLVEAAVPESLVEAAVPKQSGEFGCWSEPVLAVPGHLGKTVDGIKQHQEAIVGRMSTVGDGIAGNGDVLRELATSTKVIARELAGIKEGVWALAEAVAEIAEESAGIKGRVGELAESVDAVGAMAASGLAGVAARLDEIRDATGDCKCWQIGVGEGDGVNGKHDKDVENGKSGENGANGKDSELQQDWEGWRGWRRSRGWRGRLDGSDLPGIGDASRPVDVGFREGDFGPDPEAERESRPRVEGCGCPMK